MEEADWRLPSEACVRELMMKKWLIAESDGGQ